MNQAQYWIQLLSQLGSEALRLCIWLLLLGAVLLPLELLLSRRSAAEKRVRIESFDLLYFFINGLLPGLLLTAPLALLAVMARHLVPEALPQAVATLPLWLRLLLVLVVSEVGFYWGHRLSHKVPFLWRFHAVHHAPKGLNFLVNLHAHPLDLCFNRLCGFIPLYLLGLIGPTAGGTATPFALIVFSNFWAHFVHADVRWRLGPLEQLISSPAFHHWHHNRDERADCNFASLLPWMDRLFGTHHLPKHWPTAYGITADHPAGLWQQMAEPLKPAARPSGSNATSQA
ncbi:sterol desaturase family protein [Paucibacter sp. TC2R-5]|uniref:sterol desaturase family protein n=1 Tax=Paucibacter sp. TC2R-5 TaxID=2893555 RepID=UPI0021E3C855|nr:sterol desaturase family protein [Paucibacter sp. TC2R-5]MCV2360649.1 sterol desaturase family protein [Paucibacter sp. TC2R-5]